MTLKAVRDDLEMFSEAKSLSINSLSSTVILVINSPMGLLMCHVGDGRAGYKDFKGKWHHLLTPHKGEEANQTLFLTSEFWNIPYFRISKVRVPEALVIREPVKAFVLMSDGCEHSCWECNKYDDERKVYIDPNYPHAGFFDPIIHTICNLDSFKDDEGKILTAWRKMLNDGVAAFAQETDDKTLIVGVSLF